jgi:tetratricopeptide (TPR) repeat protein
MNKILRLVTLVGIFIIPFIPLIVFNTLFFPFITGKNFAFRIVVEIVFAAWAILALTNTAYRPRRSWLLYALLAFVAIIGIADATGFYPYKSFWSNYERMEGWVTLAHLAAYFVVAGIMLSKEKLWDAFFQTSLGVNFVVIVYSLLQIGKQLTINQGGVRVDATFGNATYLAIFALFNIFIAALYVFRKRELFHSFKNGYFALGFNAGFFLFMLPLLSASALSGSKSTSYLWAFLALIIINIIFYATTLLKQERIVYGLLIVLNLFVLYHTATRGAMLGLIGGVALAGLLIAIFEREHPRVRRAAAGAIMIAVLVVITFFAAKNTPVVQNSQVLSRFASISLTEKTTLSRFKLWDMAIQGFKERPILGWGQENFNYVFNKYYNPELYNQEQWFDRTHNVIFDWLIAGGVLGLAAYLFFFASIVYYIWRARGEGRFTIIERGILTGLLAAYFIHNLFVFDNLTSYIVFFAIAAYVYNRSTMRPEPEHRVVSNQVILPVAAVVLIVVLYAVNVRPILANRALITAISTQQSSADITRNVQAFKDALAYQSFGDPEIREQLMSLGNQVMAVQEEIKGKEDLIALAATEGKKQTEITPNDARYFVFYGSYLAQMGNLKDATTYLEKARDLSPKKQSILFALSGIYMVQGDYKNAESTLKATYEYEPNYLDAKLAYAAAAIYNNNLKTVDELLSGIPTSTIASNNDIVQAYYTTKNYSRLIALWKARVQAEPSAQNHVSLAAAYLYANDKKNAIAELREAIKIDPNFKQQGEEYIKQIQQGKI